MVEHWSDEDVKALREHVAALLTGIKDLMAAIGNVEIVGQGRIFDLPPGPVIGDRFFEVAEELLDPDLPVDRLLDHALGLELALQKLRAMAGLWTGRVEQHAAGLNSRRVWAAEIAAMAIGAVVTLASVTEALHSRQDNDPGVLRALTLVAPHGPDGPPCFHGSERAA